MHSALLKQSFTTSHNDAMIAAIECIVCDCAVAQEAFDACDTFAALFRTVSQSASTATHAEVCRVIVALLRGRGRASRLWCDVSGLSDGVRTICSAADAHSCEAAAELLDTLAAEMDESVAEMLRARGDLPIAVDQIAAVAPSHWCRVVLLSAVYRFILLASEFRSTLCSKSVVRAAHAAMRESKDDFECGTIANAVGELVRGHGGNKAVFSCEATCTGLLRMAETAVEQDTVQVSFSFSPCLCVRCALDTCSPQDIAFLISSLYNSSNNPSIHRSASVSEALFIL